MTSELQICGKCKEPIIRHSRWGGCPVDMQNALGERYTKEIDLPPPLDHSLRVWRAAASQHASVAIVAVESLQSMLRDAADTCERLAAERDELKRKNGPVTRPPMAEKPVIPKVVFKYPLELGATTISLPSGTEILHVGEQDEELRLWALLPTSYETGSSRVFIVLGTGHTCARKIIAHVGTVKIGAFVWHVFEVEP